MDTKERPQDTTHAGEDKQRESRGGGDKLGGKRMTRTPKKERGNVMKTEGKKCEKGRMFYIKMFSLKLEQE